MVGGGCYEGYDSHVPPKGSFTCPLHVWYCGDNTVPTTTDVVHIADAAFVCVRVAAKDDVNTGAATNYEPEQHGRQRSAEARHALPHSTPLPLPHWPGNKRSLLSHTGQDDARIQDKFALYSYQGTV